jgi:hypothetical protein
MTGTFRSGGPRQDNNSFETPALHVATVGLEGVGDTKGLRPSVIKRAAVVLVHLSRSLKNVTRGKDLHLLPRCTLQAGSPFRSCRRFSNEALPSLNLRGSTTKDNPVSLDLSLTTAHHFRGLQSSCSDQSAAGALWLKPKKDWALLSLCRFCTSCIKRSSAG